MGLFSSSSSAPPPAHENAKPSSDGAYIAPDRYTRARCYEARDKFFACLEQNGIIDSIKDKEQADKVCGNEERGMALECAASWVGLGFSFTWLHPGVPLWMWRMSCLDGERLKKQFV